MLWKFEPGDQVFCVWPVNNQWVKFSGYHTVKTVEQEGRYLTFEGYKELFHSWRFIKIPKLEKKQITEEHFSPPPITKINWYSERSWLKKLYKNTKYGY